MRHGRETQGPSTTLRFGRDDRLYWSVFDNTLIALELCEKRLQFWRERSFEGKQFFRAGMVEFQSGCMQEVSGERERFVAFLAAGLFLQINS